MAINTQNGKYYLLSNQARVEIPYVKVVIGNYSFGIFTKDAKSNKDINGFYNSQNFTIQYPNYIQNLTVQKINGQVNQYTLSINYPITPTDDPNFFEKVFSSVSMTRKIVFSYGDYSMPGFFYKDEEAIITAVSQTFNLVGSAIQYTVKAVSGAALGLSGCYNFMNSGRKKPSDEIKRLFKNSSYGLQKIFTGMNAKNIDYLIAGDDAAVELSSKQNMPVLEYLNYLVGCMIPDSGVVNNRTKEIYILTIHDDTIYDKIFSERDMIAGEEIVGPYFKISKTSHAITQSDAYNIDIGYNTNTIVTSFSIENNENFSIFYDYQSELSQEKYVRRINDKGMYEDVYAPNITSNNVFHETRAEDTTWWTKITRFPINATIVIQGLLRPAMLMTYVRLNVIFPGGRKHISSGLYIVTAQTDSISESGYKTTLRLTKIDGDTLPTNW